MLFWGYLKDLVYKHEFLIMKVNKITNKWVCVIDDSKRTSGRLVIETRASERPSVWVNRLASIQ